MERLSSIKTIFVQNLKKPEFLSLAPVEVLHYSDHCLSAFLLLRPGERRVSTNLPGGLATP